MKVKMLKWVDGKIKTSYVDIEQKKLADSERQKHRRLNRMPKEGASDRIRKSNLQERQKLAKELRDIKVKLKGSN